MALQFIHTAFENASPVNWHVDDEGIVHIRLLYDHERNSPNRAAGHWHIQLQATPGDVLKLIFENFDNIWNGRPGSPISDCTHCYLSPDGKVWSAVPARKTPENRLELTVPMETDTLYLARLEPYRLSDLEHLIAEIADHPLVEVTPIGHTAEGRKLEIIRVGHPEATHRVLLRGRSHAWEPGGNWVLQGLIRSLLREEAETRPFLESYCVYAMPISNKDGVARGYTRFNVLGKDLNRDWDHPADSEYAPENHAFETWIEAMIEQGQRPHLAIDLHNDNSGKLHISRPECDLEAYLAKMQRLEALLFEHTWFTEGSTGSNFRNPGSFGEGMLERYGIDGCILELNCDWIAGLDKMPFGKDWELLGKQMREVFLAYFCEQMPSHANSGGDA